MTVNHKPGPRAAVASRGTVLVAEDNKINREVARGMLSRLGYQCRCAATGLETVDCWRKGGVDLILMDCQMPEMDGYEATRAIRLAEAAAGQTSRMPIVALTAHAADQDRKLCLEAGMDDFLSKPADSMTLARMLAQWIPVNAGMADGCPAPGPIDYPRLLQRCLNKPELAARLMRLFLGQADQDVMAILAAVQKGDATALAASAHRLKGASANASAEGLHRVSARLEELGRGGDVAAARALLVELQLEFSRLRNVPDAMDKPAVPVGT